MAHFRYHTKMDERYTCMNQSTENTILWISLSEKEEREERRERVNNILTVPLYTV